MGWYRVYPDNQLFGSSEDKFVASLTHSFIPGTRSSKRHYAVFLHVYMSSAMMSLHLIFDKNDL
jgi:hypothetical protein